MITSTQYVNTPVPLQSLPPYLPAIFQRAQDVFIKNPNPKISTQRPPPIGINTILNLPTPTATMADNEEDQDLVDYDEEEEEQNVAAEETADAEGKETKK